MFCDVPERLDQVEPAPDDDAVTSYSGVAIAVQTIAATGAVTAACAAVYSARRAQRIATQDRRIAGERIVRERERDNLTKLAGAILDDFSDEDNRECSIDGKLACYALWSVRNWIGLPWDYYIEEREQSVLQRYKNDPRAVRNAMLGQVTDAIDKLRYQDAPGDSEPQPRSWPSRMIDRLFGPAE